MAHHVPVPADFLLHRDACSYGYFRLAPNLWTPDTRTLTRILDLPAGPVTLHLTQPPGGGRGDAALRGRPLRIVPSRPLDAGERAEVSRAVERMLRLTETDAHLRAFHKADPRWKASGRGRLFRSPSLFEDVVKTVTSCNVTWPGTIAMNRALCAVLGRGGAFPSPERLRRARPSTLRARCRVGYRDTRLIALADLFARGAIDEAALCDPARPDDAVFKELQELPGVGPYAAANIMQLLGRYAFLPLDSEALRHGRTVLGHLGTDREVLNAVRAHFAPFGAHAFRSYWLELWAHYEAKEGPAWEWPLPRPPKTPAPRAGRRPGARAARRPPSEKPGAHTGAAARQGNPRTPRGE
ncbi:MAG: hypothetical protein IT439_01775 [Phycisphaerales bacterium]|nr:hypothetical protein [Phycisphaerales bacterium]